MHLSHAIALLLASSDLGPSAPVPVELVPKTLFTKFESRPRRWIVHQPLKDASFDVHGKVPKSDLEIAVTSGDQVKQLGKKLVLPVSITNRSETKIETELAHEWHGGLWPPTSIYASVTPDGAKEPVPFHAVYRVHESPDRTKGTAVAPGKAAQVNLRMDWPGTGSVKTTPLIPKPGKYQLRLALVFSVAGKSQYVVTEPTTIEWQGEDK